MIRINKNGGIIINDEIVCDGHDSSAILRIQSHIHSDHLADFGSSKQQSNIVMSLASKEYLAIGKNNLDITHRPGIIGLLYDEIYNHEGYQIKLLSNEHCLGSAQIEIVTPIGDSFGYSGDFNYPIDQFINVKNLIIDGNCGGLFKYRKFTREDSIEALIAKLLDLLNEGPVYIRSYKGLLEKIYFWLADVRPDVCRVGSPEFIRSLELHQKYSYGLVRDLINKNSSEEIYLKKSKANFIQFVNHKEQIFNIEKQQVINCDRWLDNVIHPLREISPKCYHISFSDHADILGTLEYIRNVAPNTVFIDGVRAGKNTHDLANIIQNECSVRCQVILPT